MKNRSDSKNNRQSYMIRKYVYSQSKKQQKKETVVFLVIDDEYIGIHMPYSLNKDEVKVLIRENNGSWCTNWKLWKIPRTSYSPIRAQFPRLLPETVIEDIPLFIDKICKVIPQKLKINGSEIMISYDPMDRRIEVGQNPLYKKLYQFQKMTLELAIKNFGRLIIGDEMGIGKSLQSLACALIYQHEWPLLIICPASLKYVWVVEIKKWMKEMIKKQYIQVVDKYGTALDFSVLKIAIYSYEIAAKSIQYLSRFKVVIVDEAHYLRNSNIKRTQNLVPYLMSRKRIFLLSGTPALAKPKEIFNLIQIIRPNIFYSLKEFGDRYCLLERNRWSNKIQYDGCRNTAELHYILKNKIMIRRLKADVLFELPQKQRQIIEIQTNKNYVKQIKQLLNSNQIPLDVLRNNEKLIQFGEHSDNLSPLPKCYLLSGLAKIEGIKNYISSLFENDIKILIFAHHQLILNELQQHLQKQKILYIRIDGKTNQINRIKFIQNFQNDNGIKAALLSITANCHGVTLTAASTVVFAQLHWTPGNLIQAEDRAHRMGQKSCVNVHYLIGESTLDHILLKQLQKKLQITGDILNGNKQNLQAECVQKGKIGRLSTPNYYTDNNRLKSQRSIKEWVTKTVQKNKIPSNQSDIDEDQLSEDQIDRLIRSRQQEIKQKNKIKVLSGNSGWKK